MLLPPLAAAVAAYRTLRGRPLTWDQVALAGCGGGLVAGVGFAVLASLSGGAAGPGRMRFVGPFVPDVLVHGVTACGIGALLGAGVVALLRGLLGARARAGDVPDGGLSVGAGHSHGERTLPRSGPARPAGSSWRSLVGPLVLATLAGAGPALARRRPRDHRTGRRRATRARREVQDIGACRQRRRRLPAGAGGAAQRTGRTRARPRRCCPTAPQAPEVEPGDRIIVSYAEQAPEGEQYAFQDFDRGPPLLTLTLLFAVGVLALSRWRGIGALASLAYSLVLIAVFTLPAIMEGSSPLAVAVVTAAAIMLVTLYLSHGFDVRTTVAMLGTLVSLRGDRRDRLGLHRASATSPAWSTRAASTSPASPRRSTCAACCSPVSSSAPSACSTTSPSPRPGRCGSSPTSTPTRARARCSCGRCGSGARTPPPPSTRWSWPTSVRRCR